MHLLVVTPTLGTSASLAETITSVAASRCECAHLLVAPEPACSNLHAQFPDLRLVQESGPGMYAALSTGLAAARSEDWDWFTYLNDDDLWDDHGMRAALALATDITASADVLYGRVRLIHEDGRPAGELPVARHPADLRALLQRGVIPFAQPGMMIRRSLLEKLDGFDASYRSAGDLDLCVRALLAGARFAFVPHVVAAFRLRTNQLSKNQPQVASETARALAPLREGIETNGRLALLRFRAANIGVYLDRFRHHGWARMSDVYRKA